MIFAGFIQVAYCVIIPLLLLFCVIPSYNKTISSIIAAANLLLVFYSLVYAYNLYGYYNLSKLFYHHLPKQTFGLYIVQWTMVTVMPLFSLYKPLRGSYIFSAFLVVLFYWINPPFTWNTIDLFVKIPFFLSGWCAAYALLWLMKQLPHQSRNK